MRIKPEKNNIKSVEKYNTREYIGTYGERMGKQRRAGQSNEMERKSKRAEIGEV